MTRPFHNAGLCIDNARTHLEGLEYLRLHDPESYAEQDGRLDYERTVGALRCWLVSMRDAIEQELSRLPSFPVSVPEGDPLPEKAAGHISESMHG